MDLDFLDCFRRKKLCSITEEIVYLVKEIMQIVAMHHMATVVEH